MGRHAMATQTFIPHAPPASSSLLAHAVPPPRPHRLRRLALGQRWVDSPPHRSSEHTPRPIVGLDGAADTAVLGGRHATPAPHTPR